jgi:hypothetical protein
MGRKVRQKRFMSKYADAKESTYEEAHAHRCDLGYVDAIDAYGEVMDTWRDPEAQRLDAFDLWGDEQRAAGAVRFVAVCACGEQKTTWSSPKTRS